MISIHPIGGGRYAVRDGEETTIAGNHLSATRWRKKLERLAKIEAENVTLRARLAKYEGPQNTKRKRVPSALNWEHARTAAQGKDAA